MRKTLKLLTLVLTLALVFGTLAVAIFAADGDQLTVTADGVQQYLSSDFSKKLDSSIFGGSNAGFALFKLSETASGNKYVQVDGSKDKTGATTNTIYFNTRLGIVENKNPATVEEYNYLAALKNSYIVHDFELGADRYVKNGSFVDTKEEADSLSYYKSITVTAMSRYWGYVESKNAVSVKSYDSNAYYIYTKDEVDDGLKIWYFGDKNKLEYRLPNVAGQVTHFTYVYEVDNTVIYNDGTTGVYDASKAAEIESYNITKSKLHIYINGEHFVTAPTFDTATYATPEFYASEQASVESIALDQVRIQPAGKDADYSLIGDNVSTHYYAAGYNGAFAAQMKADPTAPLYNCNDVVYNANYVSANGVIGTVDGVDYNIEGKMIAAIKEGSVVTLKKSTCVEYAPKADFTLVTNGYNLALAEGYELVETDVPYTYTVQKIVPKATVIWGEKGSELYAETVGYPSTNATHPWAKTGTLLDGDILLGWTTVKGGTTPETIVTGENNSTITVYPVIEEGDYEYVILVDNQIKVKGTDINTLVTTYNGSYKNNSNVTIILGADFDMVSQKDVAVDSKSGKPYLFFYTSAGILNFDQNGYDVYVVQSPNTSWAFFNYAGSNRVVNFYSSRPGADYINIFCTEGADGTLTYNAYETAALGTTRSDCVFNVGNGQPNLTIHTSRFVNAGGPNFEMNMDNVTIIAPRSNGHGLIYTSNGVAGIKINVKDSTIAGPTYLFSVHGTHAHTDNSLDVTVENSTLVATGAGNIVFRAWNSKYTFTNCDIVGKLAPTADATDPASIIIGDGCRYTEDIFANAYVSKADGLVIYENSTKKNVSYNLIDAVYDANTDKFTEASLATAKNVSVTAKFIAQVLTEDKLPKQVEVYWYYRNMKINQTPEIYRVGQTATFDAEKYSIDFPRINGWFIDGISGWSKTSGGEACETIVTNSTNHFYAIEGPQVDLQTLYNYTTTQSFETNYYVPVPAEDSGVELVGIWEKGVNLISSTSRCRKVTINGAPYLCIISWPGVYEDRECPYTVEYTYGGETYSVLQTVKPIVEYFFEVIETTDPDDETMTLIVNSANYVLAVRNYLNKGYTVEGLEEIVEVYSEYLIEVSDETYAADAVMDVSGLGEYIKGVTFAIGDGYLPAYAFDADASVSSVTWKYASGNGKNYTKTSNRDDKGHWGTLIAKGASVGVYDIRQPITITAANINGTNTTISGTYSLAAYIVWLQGEVDNNTEYADAEALAVVEALYAYSIASYDYKTRNAGK